MNIYVQSRGFDQDEDYRWQKINRGESGQIELPPISVELGNLIDNDTPSLVLAQLSEELLLLLITGIEPEGRIDFLDRQIRISVAWVGDISEEPILRYLAIRALNEQEPSNSNLSLENSLAAAIDQAITFGGEYGFEVSPSLMEELIFQSTSTPFPSSNPPNPTKKIGPNLPKLKNQLAEELQDCHLPREIAPLVVVTGIKKRETLESRGIWRSLSSLVDTDDWIEIPEKSWLSALNLPQGQDLKNPVMWLILLTAIVSYLISFLVNLISARKKLPSWEVKSQKSKVKS
ncbi:MAG TPA: hypothetical protein DDW51_04695, partial [Cyanobacteria bacterium UBA11367]|nr:hypothetical protein [Cyanobacteria bacterium UBA11367]